MTAIPGQRTISGSDHAQGCVCAKQSISPLDSPPSHHGTPVQNFDDVTRAPSLQCLWPKKGCLPPGAQNECEIAGGPGCMQVMCVCRAMRMPGRMQLLQRPAGEAKLPGSSSPSSPRERVAPGAASCRCTGGTAAESRPQCRLKN